MRNPNQKTVDEVTEVGKRLRYEGKVDKDTLDWFEKDFSRKQRDIGNKQRHREQESPVHNIR
jgi:hypothetical protein